MSRNHVSDSDGNVYYRRALLRGGEVFVPAVLVADYFDLVYSASAVGAKVAGEDEAWLVWLRNKDWTLSEKAFTDAAGSMMRDRYDAYNRKQDVAIQPEQPAEDENRFSGKELYLAFLADTAEQTEPLLDALDRTGSQAAFFCTEDFLQEEGNLLRRMTAMGHAVGLLADGEDESRSVEEQLAAGNEALYRATCTKTRLVYLTHADAEIARATEAAGYGLLIPHLDHTAYGLRNSSGVSLLIQRATSRQGDVSVWLGENVTSLGLREFLADAAREENRCLALAEPLL
jgi:peptidoglycan/xylan/chitin deacetylase (PgdA/CDA1 family)